MHTLSTREEDTDEFKAGLGYTVRLQLKKPKETKIKADKKIMFYGHIYMKYPKEKRKIHEGRGKINNPRSSRE